MIHPSNGPKKFESNSESVDGVQETCRSGWGSSGSLSRDWTILYGTCTTTFQTLMFTWVKEMITHPLLLTGICPMTLKSQLLRWTVCVNGIGRRDASTRTVSLSGSYSPTIALRTRLPATTAQRVVSDFIYMPVISACSKKYAIFTYRRWR